MDTEQERSFADFLIKEKAVLKEEDFQICLEVQAALRKFDLEKSIEKIIVEKGFLSEKCIATLLQEFKGGDDNFIPGYLVTKKLGEGAMGEVYQGIDLNNNNRPVAIKVLFPHLGKKKSTAKRFLQEGTLCIEKLNHANIVKGYEIGYEANYDFFFYVMELMDGANVRELIDQKGPLSEPVAIKILIQITSALDHAYS
ncbi:MAG TPA: protein kinase, partial [Planctomycetota bacterium]|nr:protein kinase [Planctomycetota bacterium]